MPANTIPEQITAAIATRVTESVRGIHGAAINVYCAGWEPVASVYGAEVVDLTVAVEQRIDLSDEGVDWGTTGEDTIRLKIATDLHAAIMTGDLTLGGLVGSIPVPVYEPAVRQPNSDDTGVLLTYTFERVAWTQGDPTSQAKVPRT